MGDDYNAMKTTEANTFTMSYRSTAEVNTMQHIGFYGDSIRGISIDSNKSHSGRSIHGFHEDVDDDDQQQQHVHNLMHSIRTRPTSQSVDEQEPELQAQIYEYQRKEKEWKENMEDIEAENDRLNSELIDIKKQ